MKTLGMKQLTFLKHKTDKILRRHTVSSSKQLATELEHWIISLVISVGLQIFPNSAWMFTFSFVFCFSSFTSDTNMIQIPEVFIIVEGTSHKELVWNFKSNKVCYIQHFEGSFSPSSLQPWPSLDYAAWPKKAKLALFSLGPLNLQQSRHSCQLKLRNHLLQWLLCHPLGLLVAVTEPAGARALEVWGGAEGLISDKTFQSFKLSSLLANYSRKFIIRLLQTQNCLLEEVSTEQYW